MWPMLPEPLASSAICSTPKRAPHLRHESNTIRQKAGKSTSGVVLRSTGYSGRSERPKTAAELDIERDAAAAGLHRFTPSQRHTISRIGSVYRLVAVFPCLGN